MAHVTADRVRDTSTTTGTGAFAVSGTAPTGYRTFSAVLTTNDTCWYAIQHQTAAEWEVGLGTYSSANTITRTTVLASSNSGSAVSFSAGTKDVFITLAASKTVQQDASGNVGIGTSSPSYKLTVSGAVGVIFANINMNDAYDVAWGTSVVRGATGASGYVALAPNGAYTVFADVNGFYPLANDNARTCGSASYRWSVVYAATGTINTSDAREKQQIADLDAAEKRAATAIKGLVKKFKFNDAVAAKGDDARIHVGVVAQDVAAAFVAEGLDPSDYALFCHDTWEATEEVLDQDGSVQTPARPAGDRYGVRYEELLAFMISAL